MPTHALLYRRPNEPPTIDITFDGSAYPVRLRRHRQARRYTLRIQATTREIVLTIPPRGTLQEARSFAQKHGGWIAARLGRLPQAVPFADGAALPLRGLSHRISHRPGLRGTVWTETDGDGERLLCVAGHAPHIARRVADFLQQEAKRDLESASHRFARDLGLTVVAVSHDLLALGVHADELICINGTAHIHGHPQTVLQSPRLREAYRCEFDFLSHEADTTAAHND